MKACKVCHRLVDKLASDAPLKKGQDTKGVDENVCPVCHGQTSKTWQGYVIVQDVKKSRIARKMNLTGPGRYALKVR